MMDTAGVNMGRRWLKEIQIQGGYSNNHNLPFIFLLYLKLEFKVWKHLYLIANWMQELLQVHKRRVHGEKACGKGVP